MEIYKPRMTECAVLKRRRRLRGQMRAEHEAQKRADSVGHYQQLKIPVIFEIYPE